MTIKVFLLTDLLSLMYSENQNRAPIDPSKFLAWHRWYPIDIRSSVFSKNTRDTTPVAKKIPWFSQTLHPTIIVCSKLSWLFSLILWQMGWILETKLLLCALCSITVYIVGMEILEMCLPSHAVVWPALHACGFLIHATWWLIYTLHLQGVNVKNGHIQSHLTKLRQFLHFFPVMSFVNNTKYYFKFVNSSLWLVEILWQQNVHEMSK